jgi:hypothetical protein
MTHWTDRSRQIIRAGLVVVSIPAAILAVWATAAPRSFYDEFPGAGHSWVSPSGPYNEHLVRDVGAFNLGLLVLALFAFVTLERRVVQAALAAFAAAGTPHLVFHLTDTESLPTADNVVSLAALVLVVAVPLALLPLTRAPSGSTGAGSSTPERRTAVG